MPSHAQAWVTIALAFTLIGTGCDTLDATTGGDGALAEADETATGEIRGGALL